MAEVHSPCWPEGSARPARLAVLLAAAVVVGVAMASMLLRPGIAGAAVGARPVNLTAPTVRGTAARGDRLTASRGRWRSARAYGYHWLVSFNGGVTWRRIKGVRGPSYRPTKADEGARIKVTVTAANASGRAAAASRAVGPVKASPPVNITRPEIWGLARSEASVRALTIGSWRGVGNSVAYRWQRSKGRSWRSIAKATRRQYRLTIADVGSRVRLLVRVSNRDGSRAVASAATRRVAPGPPVSRVAPPPPSGTAAVSSVLTGQPGRWFPASPALFYTWFRCPPAATTTRAGCVPIAVGPRYTVAAGDVGYRIGTRVSATSAAVTRNAYSALTDPVADAVVTLGGVARAVPPSFLGLSVETNELASFERNVPDFANLLRLLQTGDGSPLALRVGGQTSDQTYLNGDGFTVPRGAIGIDSAYMQNLGQLARSVPLSVMFDLNLEAESPAMAAAVASEALKALPAGSLAALEVGNEPDLYRTGLIGNNWNPDDLQRFANYSPADYAADFGVYAAALASAAPGVPLAGPSISNFGPDWLGALLSADRPNVGLLTGHRYPLSACAAPGSLLYPTIAGQLSSRASAGIANSVRNVAVTAHQAGLTYRVDELGSATCTGLYGVSDTFATALWAPDALFNLLAAGADGVNVHTRYNSANTPIWGAGTPRTRPFFYGMVAFARTLGPGAALLQSSVAGQLPAGLSVWPVRLAGNRMHVLLINKGSSQASVTLRTGARAAAVVQLLQSSSMAPGARVTFGGQQISDSGAWQGTPVSSTVAPQSGDYRLGVPPLTASLLSFDSP
jgi:hypothetical protein